jgi:hypothetical protein
MSKGFSAGVAAPGGGFFGTFVIFCRSGAGAVGGGAAW